MDCTCPASGANKAPLYSAMTMATAAAVPQRGQPVAPADDEAGVVADSAPGEIVLAAAARNRGAEFGQGRCADERVESTDDPNAKEEINVGQPLRDVAGRADDTRGNGVADGRGDAEPHAENFKKPALGTRPWSGV